MGIQHNIRVTRLAERCKARPVSLTLHDKGKFKFNNDMYWTNTVTCQIINMMLRELEGWQKGCPRQSNHKESKLSISEEMKRKNKRADTGASKSGESAK